MSSITVYKASAGSGKTFTLAVQYIRLLITINPLEYRHTLAVTFTNKATAEMKDRILEQLYGISRSLKGSEGYLEALQKSLVEVGVTMDDKEIRKRCGDALRYILHDYSRFRIETIDSFFQSVLRNLAHELGLNARLQIDLNDKQILSQAVDNLVDSLDGKGAVEGNVLPWIDEYVSTQLENSEGWDIRGTMKSFSSLIFKEEYMQRDADFHRRIADEARIKAYRKKLYEIKGAVTKVMEETVKVLNEQLANFPGDLTKVISTGTWVITYRDKLLAGNYAGATITDKRMEALQDTATMVKKSDQHNTALLAALEPVRQALLSTEAQRQHYLTIVNTVDLSIHHLSPLRLLGRIEEEVTNITNETGRFILAKTPILLNRLIEGSDAPFVFEKMGTLFHNVMIDEFQDTSRLQWNNFKVLLLESQAQGGNNLIVGDVKQSIYRFRGGDWHILQGITKEFNTETPHIETLGTNYRSDIEVIDFNNHFFCQAAKLIDTQDEVGLIQQIYSDVKQKWPADKQRQGFVRVMLKDGAKEWEQTMLDDLCDQISSLHASGLDYRDMAILLRSRTNVPKLIEHVGTKLGVKLVSDEGFQLGSSHVMGMLVAALRVLDCSGHHQGKKNRDIISERYLVKQYLLHVMHRTELHVQDFATLAMEEVLPEAFYAHLDSLREYPLQELCEELFTILHLSEIKDEDAYTLTFFDELSSYLQYGTTDISSFLEYWDDEMCRKSIPACQVDGINIVTIHKSKGLQYHTVFMPFCDTPMEDIRYDELLWCDAGEAPYNEMGRLPINGSKEKFLTSEYEQDYRNEQLQRRIEEFNILYVAFTRAEHNLYVWGKGDAPGLTDASLLNEALARVYPDQYTYNEEGGYNLCQLGTPFISEQKKEKKKEDNRLSPDYEKQDIRFTSMHRHFDFRQSNEAERYLEEQGEEEALEEARTADGLTFIEQGKLLHEVFSHIERSEQAAGVVQTYLDRGILASEKQRDRITKLISKALSLPQVQPWFDGSQRVINECEIVHIDPETGEQVTHRPDRVMLSDTSITIVDFKFGRPHPEQYEPQVQGYMRLIQEMYPDHTVSGFLWYVYRNEVAPVPELPVFQSSRTTL